MTLSFGRALGCGLLAIGLVGYTSIKRGKNLYLYGFLQSAMPGSTLQFQEYVGNSWRTIAIPALDRNATGHVWVRTPRKRTTLAFRTYIPADNGDLASYSSVLPVKVK